MSGPNEKLLLENQVALRMAMHDLANPLSVILTAANICLGMCDDHPARTYLEMIRGAALEQRGLLKNLKATQSLMVGDQPPETEPVDLPAVVETLQALYGEAMKAKDQTLVVDLDEGVGMVSGRYEVVQFLILSTLVSNAMKFSPKGAQIELGARPDGEERVLVWVRDNGIGMDATKLQNLFNFEQRRPEPGTDGEKGVGLGMPLLKLAVDRIGALVRISSVPEKDDTELSGTLAEVRFLRAEEAAG